MGLWIRSQNKEILINTKRLFVNELVENKKISGYSIDSGGIELGRYSTKAKALRVLDKIQKRINESIYINDIAEYEKEIYTKNVFEMPPDMRCNDE